MNDFNRSNKVTGVHWLKQPIDNLIIKVQIKPQNGLSLPHFEDFKDRSNTSFKHGDITEEYTFKWQHKTFSAWELQRFADVHNCITDTELNYHEMIKDHRLQPKKIFTYIHEDNYPATLPDLNRKTTSSNNIESVTLCMDKLNIHGKLGEYINSDTVSMAHLFRSEENIVAEEGQWIAMHVVMDNSQYNEESELLLKQDAILLSLYHNGSQQCLIISPDGNSLEWNPYTVETSSGVRLNYQYAVDISFEESGDGGEELSLLLRKLLKKWEKKNKQLLNFAMPPLGSKQYFITFEILSAVNFDVENMDLYIEFYVKYPEGVSTNEVHHGRTHTTRGLKTGDGVVWYYSHLVELWLECEVDTDATPIQLYMEVISVDWWGRHRTEGYCYLPLDLDPGQGHQLCPCVRPEERDKVEADARRFFVGGCHLIRDLAVLTKPKMQHTNYRYVSAGSVSVRWSTLLQSHVPGVVGSTSLTDRPSASTSALLLGAEQVLRQYRRARARLHAATEGLGGIQEEGSGDS